MSEGAAPVPLDAAWTTVCFDGAAAASWDGPSAGPGRATARVRWRAHPAHGTLLVRRDPLSGTAGGLTHPGPPPCPHPPGRFPCDVQLWAAAGDPRTVRLAEYADVLVSRVESPPWEARRRVDELLLRHPGCLVAGVPESGTRCLVGVRDRTGALRYARPELRGPRVRSAVHLVASVLHAWVVAGGAPESLGSLAAGADGAGPRPPR
ncbi:hypothetical protein [Streptomyces griseoruber]|uniref:Uncharacterized protein n=1 Tax=Streptomyces griseoruber TaxID=1943 RepID=A0A101SPR2_9ACTN|nr:hypothetical protein [Streptomyces griseoruber]KUN78005.1 hypothetical protein AQJ64_32940 [Streptomyces griseoruber]